MVVAGLQVVCEAHIQRGKVLGHPPEKLDHLVLIIYIPGTSDFLCRLPLPGHRSPFHPYITFMPVRFLMRISIITVYKVHYCISIKHSQTLYTRKQTSGVTGESD